MPRLRPLQPAEVKTPPAATAATERREDVLQSSEEVDEALERRCYP